MGEDVRQQFLLTFFDENSGYSELEVNGYWLVKCKNNTTGKWYVAVYDADNFEAYKNFQREFMK